MCLGFGISVDVQIKVEENEKQTQSFDKEISVYYSRKNGMRGDDFHAYFSFKVPDWIDG